MQITRQNDDDHGVQFAKLSFAPSSPEEGTKGLNDDIVEKAIERERVRPVTQDQFGIYQHYVLENKPPTKCLVAFGNSGRGPSDRGGFAGVPVLDTDGHVKIIENWTRGGTGHEWDWDNEFLFVY